MEIVFVIGVCVCVCSCLRCVAFCISDAVTMKKLWRKVICRSASSFDVPPTTNHATFASGHSVTDNIRMRNNEVADASSCKLALQSRRRSKSESYLPTSEDCVDASAEYGHYIITNDIHLVIFVCGLFDGFLLAAPFFYHHDEISKILEHLF